MKYEVISDYFHDDFEAKLEKFVNDESRDIRSVQFSVTATKNGSFLYSALVGYVGEPVERVKREPAHIYGRDSIRRDR